MFRVPNHNRRKPIANPNVGFRIQSVGIVFPSESSETQSDWDVRFDTDGFVITYPGGEATTLYSNGRVRVTSSIA